MKPEIPKPGVVQISDGAIARIAAIACRQVPGVHDIHDGFLGGLARIFGRRADYKGIEVHYPADKEIVISLSIVVRYGAEITKVADEVQGRVKVQVEKMTGILVTHVNVSIDGVVDEAEPAAD